MACDLNTFLQKRNLYACSLILSAVMFIITLSVIFGENGYQMLLFGVVGCIGASIIIVSICIKRMYNSKFLLVLNKKYIYIYLYIDIYSSLRFYNVTPNLPIRDNATRCYTKSKIGITVHKSQINIKN